MGLDELVVQAVIATQAVQQGWEAENLPFAHASIEQYLKKAGKAEQVLLRALEVFPGSVFLKLTLLGVYLKTGDAYLDKSDLECAQAYFSRVLALVKDVAPPDAKKLDNEFNSRPVFQTFASYNNVQTVAAILLISSGQANAASGFMAKEAGNDVPAAEHLKTAKEAFRLLIKYRLHPFLVGLARINLADILLQEIRENHTTGDTAEVTGLYSDAASYFGNSPHGSYARQRLVEIKTGSPLPRFMMN